MAENTGFHLRGTYQLARVGMACELYFEQILDLSFDPFRGREYNADGGDLIAVCEHFEIISNALKTIMIDHCGLIL